MSIYDLHSQTRDWEWLKSVCTMMAVYLSDSLTDWLVVASLSSWLPAATARLLIHIIGHTDWREFADNWHKLLCCSTTIATHIRYNISLVVLVIATLSLSLYLSIPRMRSSDLRVSERVWWWETERKKLPLGGKNLLVIYALGTQSLLKIYQHTYWISSQHEHVGLLLVVSLISGTTHYVLDTRAY